MTRYQKRCASTKIVTTVENESGTIAYKWSMRPDGKTFDVVEIYQDSQAVQAHIKDVVGKYGEEIGKNWKPVKFVVYGNPDADTKKALERLHPEYEIEHWSSVKQLGFEASAC